MNTNSWIRETSKDKIDDLRERLSCRGDARIIAGGDAVGDACFVDVEPDKWEEDRVISTTHEGRGGGGTPVGWEAVGPKGREIVQILEHHIKRRLMGK